MGVFWPEHHICLARELTKMYETYHRDSLKNLSEEAKKGVFRWEIVLIF
jgi:16S rRNA C1402 (ribose-2'-O) methylase RsmI